MAEDWASRIRESIDRSNKAMDLYKRQTQAGMVNAQSGGTTRFTATDDGRIIDPGVFTANTTGISGDRFSGGPIESASFYGSGQINEVGGASTPDGGGGEGGPPTPNRRPRRGSDRWEMGDDGRMVDPSTGQHRITSRRDGSTKASQHRNNYMPPNQRTPRQRFTA